MRLGTRKSFLVGDIFQSLDDRTFVRLSLVLLELLRMQNFEMIDYSVFDCCLCTDDDMNEGFHRYDQGVYLYIIGIPLGTTLVQITLLTYDYCYHAAPDDDDAEDSSLALDRPFLYLERSPRVPQEILLTGPR